MEGKQLLQFHHDYDAVEQYVLKPLMIPSKTLKLLSVPSGIFIYYNLQFYRPVGSLNTTKLGQLTGKFAVHIKLVLFPYRRSKVKRSFKAAVHQTKNVLKSLKWNCAWG